MFTCFHALNTHYTLYATVQYSKVQFGIGTVVFFLSFSIRIVKYKMRYFILCETHKKYIHNVMMCSAHQTLHGTRERTTSEKPNVCVRKTTTANIFSFPCISEYVQCTRSSFYIQSVCNAHTAAKIKEMEYCRKDPTIREALAQSFAHASMAVRSHPPVFGNAFSAPPKSKHPKKRVAIEISNLQSR